MKNRHFFGVFNSFSYFCIRKSYPNKQSDADHGNWNGCQLITRKQGKSSNSLDFKEVYSLYRFTERSCTVTSTAHIGKGRNCSVAESEGLAWLCPQRQTVIG